PSAEVAAAGAGSVDRYAHGDIAPAPSCPRIGAAGLRMIIRSGPIAGPRTGLPVRYGRRLPASRPGRGAGRTDSAGHDTRPGQAPRAGKGSPADAAGDRAPGTTHSPVLPTG